MPKKGTHRRTRSTMPDELNMMVSGLGSRITQQANMNINLEKIADDEVNIDHPIQNIKKDTKILQHKHNISN